jgi:phosphoglycolate phosphatase
MLRMTDAGRYRLLIFDWDGTLMDSAAKIVRCFARAAADCGLRQPTAGEGARVIGLGLREAVAALFPEATPALCEAIGARYREYFLDLDDTPMPLFPGVRDALPELHARGFLLAVATGKSRRGLDRVFAETGIGPLFVASRCADETRSKPDPRMLHEILDATGVPAADALMIGDTTYDLAMASAAGMDRIAATYGAHPVAELLPHAPLACLASFAEVYRWITEAAPQDATIPSPASRVSAT